MIVLHVIRDLFALGGTPRKLLGLVRASAGSDVSHAFLVFDDTEDSLAATIAAEGVPVTVVSCGRGLGADLVAEVVREARRVEADVVSTHFARADILGGLAALRLRKPLVKNVHGIIVNESWPVLIADRALSPFRAAVVCNSQATLRAQERLGLAKRAVVVLNGVEDVVSRTSEGARERVRAELGIAAEDFVFGHVGGLIPSRDQRLLIDAVASMNAQGVSSRCLIVGDGPERDRLNAHAVSTGMESKVAFCGYRSDIPDLLAAMDVYVNMSRAEGFGIAVVEAMQAGLPPVVADSGALPEVVRDGVDGLVVGTGDADALVERLTRLAGDAALRARMGEDARRSVRQRFSIERYADEVNQVYRAALLGDVRRAA